MEHTAWVVAAMNGDDDAFYRLIVQDREKLYRIAFSYLKNEHDALEAIQEVTCRAYVRLHKLKDERYFSTWLIRIMINYCIDEVKKRRRNDGRELHEDMLPQVHGPDDIRLDRLGIASALSHIDPNLRTIIELKYFHDLTIPEIARTLERPEGTVKTWLNKALKGLRVFLQKEGDHDVRA